MNKHFTKEEIQQPIDMKKGLIEETSLKPEQLELERPRTQNVGNKWNCGALVVGV